MAVNAKTARMELKCMSEVSRRRRRMQEVKELVTLRVIEEDLA